MVTGMSHAELLRRAAERIEQLKPESSGWHAINADEDFDDEWQVACDAPPALAGLGGFYVADDLSESFARWAALMGPQVAAPLAAWLRVEADASECRTELRVASFGTSKAAEVLARTILGEPQ